LSSYSKPNEDKVDVLAVAARVGLAINVDGDFAWLKIPARWGRNLFKNWPCERAFPSSRQAITNFEHVFAVVIDRKKVIAIVWGAVGHILLAALPGVPETRTSNESFYSPKSLKWSDELLISKTMPCSKSKHSKNKRRDLIK
jgi:hypothetical protein